MHTTISHPTNAPRHVAAPLPGDAVALKRAQARERALKGFVPVVLAALDRVELNHRPYRLAKYLVQCTLARGRNFMFAPSLRFIGGPFNFSDSDVCDILTGYQKARQSRVRGLEEIGFVHRRACALDKGWLLTVLPDFSRWDVAGLYSESSREGWIAEVDGLAADFARRLSLREIDEWFPDVDAVMADLNAENAIASLAGGQAAAMGASDRRPVAVADALKVGARNAGGGGASSFSSSRKPDALEVRCANEVRSVARRGSDIPNPNDAEMCRRFGISEPSRARLSKLDRGIGQETGQTIQFGQGDSVRRDELKAKIQGDEREFYFAAKVIIGATAWTDRTGGHCPNGVKWMKRFNAGGEHRRLARAVFAEMLSVEFVVKETPAQATQDLWERMGGTALDATRLKNLSNLFKHQYKQGN